MLISMILCLLFLVSCVFFSKKGVKALQLNLPGFSVDVLLMANALSYKSFMHLACQIDGMFDNYLLRFCIMHPISFPQIIGVSFTSLIED